MSRFCNRQLAEPGITDLRAPAAGNHAMPRTYGELCQCSFADVLCLGGADTRKVLVDCGSGHGVLVKAAVQDHGCTFALGIEKYKEPAAIAEMLFNGSHSDLQAKMRFLLEDMNDIDIPSQLDGLAYDTLIIFCNNLAFHEGTVHRCVLAFCVPITTACVQIADAELQYEGHSDANDHDHQICCNSFHQQHRMQMGQT